jgi:hypothetical protein
MSFGEGYKSKKDLTFKDQKKLLSELQEKIEKACKIMHDATRNGSANFIICSGEFAKAFNDLKNN